jgi:hypothetical protein
MYLKRLVLLLMQLSQRKMRRLTGLEGTLTLTGFSFDICWQTTFLID